jgi:hypothetical protein
MGTLDALVSLGELWELGQWMNVVKLNFKMNSRKWEYGQI